MPAEELEKTTDIDPDALMREYKQTGSLEVRNQLCDVLQLHCPEYGSEDEQYLSQVCHHRRDGQSVRDCTHQQSGAL